MAERQSPLVQRAAGCPAAAMLFVASFAVSASAFPETASARPDTRTMTCQQAQEFVRRSGAVVMTTGPRTFERIVANRSFCDFDETTWLMVAPTRDVPNCRVGSYCRTRINDDGPFFRRR
jgi:hypothetical protein